ncbi:MAG: Flp pilus assembly complex ATPase component TadA [Bdellovibrionales bacterium]|nr:Flp pilus assembly complex ATPase component TadA [Bdellovibrionales bacterium]
MSVHESCHLIGVVGGKGGVGKSVFAANLACAFLQEMRLPTLLIDMDSKSAGDQNVILGLKPLKTIGEISQFTGAITPSVLGSLITPHSSGLGYIGAVQGPEQSLQVSVDLFRKQLFVLSQHFRFIIADLGCDMGPLQLGVIEDASAVTVVASPEVLVVNQTRKILNDLLSMSFPADLFQIVLNKISRTAIDSQTISQSLRRPIVGQIPQDDMVAFTALQRSSPFVISAPQSPVSLAFHEIVRLLTGGILQKLKSTARPKAVTSSQASGVGAIAGQVMPQDKGPRVRGAKKVLHPMTLLKLQVHSGLIKEMDLKKDIMNSEGDPEKSKELRNKTQKIVSSLTDRLAPQLSREERIKMIKEVLDESLGLGPLEELLADPTVTEIMVNGSDIIYVEKSGKLQLSNVTFTSNTHLRTIIERIVNPLGRRIDERTPYVDARLVDGSRVNAVIEPLAIDGPALTIRKFPQDRITANDYVTRFGSLTKSMVEFLKISVEQGLNIVISGGTGSGKTTLLNVMSGFVPANERIITVEDAAELQLKQEHVVRLETRPANMEGSGEITIRDLIRNSLRMRPDRIIVGECRDGAALDMLAAMNTGHDGSMTTVHANTPREAVARLETLCLMAGMDLPARAIREQIAGAVNLIVQICRLSDGSRKVMSVTEVVGMQGETVTLQEIFRFKEEGFDKNRKIVGQFQPMGLIPTFIEEFERRGIIVPRTLFMPNVSSSGEETSKPSSPMSKPMLNKPRVVVAGVVSSSSVPAPLKKVSGDGGGKV